MSRSLQGGNNRSGAAEDPPAKDPNPLWDTLKLDYHIFKVLQPHATALRIRCAKQLTNDVNTRGLIQGEGGSRFVGYTSEMIFWGSKPNPSRPSTFRNPLNSEEVAILLQCEIDLVQQRYQVIDVATMYWKKLGLDKRGPNDAWRQPRDGENHESDKSFHGPVYFPEQNPETGAHFWAAGFWVGTHPVTGAKVYRAIRSAGAPSTHPAPADRFTMCPRMYLHPEVVIFPPLNLITEGSPRPNGLQPQQGSSSWGVQYNTTYASLSDQNRSREQRRHDRR